MKHIIKNKSPVVSKQTVSKPKTPIQREKNRILEYNRYHSLQNISDDVLHELHKSVSF